MTKEATQSETKTHTQNKKTHKNTTKQKQTTTDTQKPKTKQKNKNKAQTRQNNTNNRTNKPSGLLAENRAKKNKRKKQKQTLERDDVINWAKAAIAKHISIKRGVEYPKGAVVVGREARKQSRKPCRHGPHSSARTRGRHMMQ